MGAGASGMKAGRGGGGGVGGGGGGGGGGWLFREERGADKGATVAVAYQWASAAAFCDVATPSQVVGDPPLVPWAPQSLVGSLARHFQNWSRVRHQPAK